MKVPTKILLLASLPVDIECEFENRGHLLRASSSALRRSALVEHGSSVRIVVTTGFAGLNSDEIDAMPALELVCCVGAGYERIDVEYARQKGVELSYGPGVNADVVADHAFALILGASRQLLSSHAAVLAGADRNQLGTPDQLFGKRLGLVGLGDVGSKVAKRALGFEMQVGYHTRRRRQDVTHQHFDQLLGLAAWCDVLVLAAPGGQETEHLVNAEVLQALGPRGYLVNVARGSLVDQVSLAHALTHNLIRGAALDVYANEPFVPDDLSNCPNLIMTPHIAGRSPQSMRSMVDLVFRNIDGHLAGSGVVTPIPQSCPPPCPGASERTPDAGPDVGSFCVAL